MPNSMLIIKYMRNNKLSKEQFCQLCNIDLTTLDDIVYFGKYQYETLSRIGEKIDAGIYEFFMY